MAAMALANMIPVLATASGATIDTFITFGTNVLTWIITSFTTIMDWMLKNPIVFIWLVISLIGAVFVFLRRTIGG